MRVAFIAIWKYSIANACGLGGNASYAVEGEITWVVFGRLCGVIWSGASD